VRGIPIGAFGLHRPTSLPEFDREERSIFRWHVTQAARALDYRQLVERFERSGPAIMIVAPSENSLISFTDEAQALLGALPEGETLTVPADAAHASLWVLGGRTYVVRNMDFLPDIILSTGAIGNLSLNAASEATRSKVQFVPGSAQRRAMILIEPLEQAVQARGKLSGFGLTPRQEEVALLLALGKGVKEIAKTCGISANTAKEHVADVYHRIEVHSREALLAKLTGVAGQG
jgi:DNA-binding CsgD family transcriptional regulator